MHENAEAFAASTDEEMSFLQFISRLLTASERDEVAPNQQRKTATEMLVEFLHDCYHLDVESNPVFRVGVTVDGEAFLDWFQRTPAEWSSVMAVSELRLAALRAALRPNQN